MSGIVLGDCLDIMSGMPEGSAHLVVTSPPYNVGKEYENELAPDTYVEMLRSAIRAIHGVLAPGGRICVNIANVNRKPYMPYDAFVKTAMLDAGFLMRGDKMLIRKVDQRLADYFAWLEEGVQKFGTPHAKRYPRWGEGPAMSDLEQQKIMDEFFAKNPELKIVREIENFVCGQECGPGTMRGMVDY